MNRIALPMRLPRYLLLLLCVVSINAFAEELNPSACCPDCSNSVQTSARTKKSCCRRTRLSNLRSGYVMRIR